MKKVLLGQPVCPQNHSYVATQYYEQATTFSPLFPFSSLNPTENIFFQVLEVQGNAGS